MRKKLIVAISIAVVAILAAIFILGYNTENEEGKSSIIDTNNATKGKEINIFLHDGVGASDSP
ncbi:MAG: hypothetical protein WEC35_02455 [Nitrosopumilaceae archaeon]